MTPQEAYQVLGLPRDATPVQVKAAYRRLVSEAHPDRGGEASEFIRIRAAYEILSAFLKEGLPEDDIPIPGDLREVIDRIVREFREHQHWAEAETRAQLRAFETRMESYIRSASRSELRQFSTKFRLAWDATINSLFTNCNTRCDSILRSYESWYAQSTQAVFDEMYRSELRGFLWRRRFWEVFAVLVALAAALTVVIGWGGPARRWISVTVLLIAVVVSFLAYWGWVRKRRKTREKVEPLSVVPFQIQQGARFQTESALRRGRRNTAALGAAGMLLGSAASGGLALPFVGAAAGAALGGAIDRLVNPTGQMRARMLAVLGRFVNMAVPQVSGYVLEVHEQLLDDVQIRIVANYQERVKDTV
ncbi:MAG: J domain-containing protein, partial [Anaerolineae bacterium]